MQLPGGTVMSWVAHLLSDPQVVGTNHETTMIYEHILVERLPKHNIWTQTGMQQLR